MNAFLNEKFSAIVDPLWGQSLAEWGIKWEITANEPSVLQLYCGFPQALIPPALSISFLQILKEFDAAKHWQIRWHTTVRAHRTQMPGKGLRSVKNTIAVASGKGGVGKSTVTVNLAFALAQAGAKVGILDADIYGPSIPLMLGEHAPVTIENERYLPVVSHGLQAMSIAYLTGDEEQALIWRGPMLAKALLQMIDLTAWQELDYLFIDLPPGTGDIQLSLVQKIPLSGAIVVTTPQEVALLDAKKAITMFTKTNINVLGIVENMSLHQCSHCGHSEALFGSGGAEKLSKKYNIPVLGQWPLDTQIRLQGDSGEPEALFNAPVGKILEETALKMAISLAQQPLNYSDKFPPVVVE